MAEPQSTRLSPGLVIMMSIATGVAVASNYYAQPLLHTIAARFGISNGSAGLIVTVAQLGYAFGLMLLVPLADMVERKRLIVVMTLLSACGLLITATAQSMVFVLIGTALTGLFSVVSQVLVPFAATLAAPQERGKVVGHVMTGLLLGILLARTVAGYLSALGGWQTVYWFGAALMIVTALVLGRALPRHHQTQHLNYPRLLASILTLFVEEPVLRTRALLGGIIFAVFSVLWTSISFLLAAAPFNYSDGTIGLFGLVGAAGALAASHAGRLADRGHAGRSTTVGLGLLLLSWLPLVFAKSSLPGLIIGILLLDLMVQAIHVTNLSVINHLHPESRNRLTAGYMTCYFIGGACGSVLSTSMYGYAGWFGVSMTGAGLSAAGLLVWWLAEHRKTSGKTN
ncbi:Predicted arabinose efflux permease, MFS family [Collimonas sp. OK242]|jgi:predicted MFS family arabinose efflux permease|uniref:MFS transporter n=1 Tax=Collimonas sp. OK242 TaxID=1798195 RepID=UPI00089D11A2|nr:MFS transporter [Collimonas sp. OK242]SDY49852.1 Predicted arabinose efflux permease, MFS family [Collimonas sp. OK242]